ncbi:hypothetical protein [Flavobacterium sp. GT3R68]|uniref:hypothetical protein n=1 Tax=Flavobacterium sp. GT3R68 TaxID=2594437 RepID=UPI000F890AE7|nr:hypothetical protein [Flavobacterium sp. GT3R68]RTY95849.1 hypothetical protein EKL32_04175 [Flavobacterium sp. GSN2]TRW93621.1 hypothetical protein FNW07_01565 [Flavobacterium sp. GT3R68]
MKAITLLASIFIMCISCNCQKKAVEPSNIVANQEAQANENLIPDTQNGMKIEYEANTRGFYEKVTIQNQTIMVSKDRNGADQPVAKKISDADWKALTAFFTEVNLAEMPNLKAPTEKRFHDGAPIAELKITYKDKDYTSSNFDHGFPPAQIKKLVDKVVSLTEQE